jgi:hypothetical protein
MTREMNLTDDNYDRLWKMRTIFDKLIDSYAKNYILTEHLAVNKIIFKEYIPKKHSFG